jgi:hypothetical protein
MGKYIGIAMVSIAITVCVLATSMSTFTGSAAAATHVSHTTARSDQSQARYEACERRQRRLRKKYGARRAHQLRCTAPVKTHSVRKASPAPATASAPGTIWDGSFGSGKIDSNLYPWASFVGNHVSVVSDPLGSGQNVAKFAIDNSDLPDGALNSRGDMESPHLFTPTTNDNVYVSIPVLIPSSFPNTDAGWFQVGEIYGPPHGGSPPIGLDLWNPGDGNHLELCQDATHNYTCPWRGPVLDGGWHTVTFHIQFSTDPSVGYVEVWYDGVPQQINGGVEGTAGMGTRLYYATLVSGINWDGTSANYLNINSYRELGSYPGTVTFYHGAPKIGTTLASVTPDAGASGP